MERTSWCTLLLLLLLSAPGAQQREPAAMTLANVRATGLQRFALSDVMAATGLSIGARVTIADLQAAADRLSKSGMAASVSFQYTYSGDTVTVTFAIEEATADTDVIFDNFPWFSDDELAKTVGAVVPGFDGRIPDVAEVIDTIEATLERLLRAKQVTGGVEYLPFLDASTGRRAHLFRAVARLPICRVILDGVAVSFRNELTPALAPLDGREYLRTNVKTFAAATLVPIYRRRGHLRVTLRDPVAEVEETDAGCAGGVRVRLPVDEGLQYSWKGASWSGHRLFAAHELDQRLNVGTDEVADGVQLDAGIAAIERAYARKGHLMMRSTVRPVYDDHRRGVRYDVTLDEGPEYRMGVVTFVTNPPDASTRLQQRWALKAGSVFDAEYAWDFMKFIREKSPELLAGMKGFKVDIRPRTDPFVADVTVTVEY